MQLVRQPPNPDHYRDDEEGRAAFAAAQARYDQSQWELRTHVVTLAVDDGPTLRAACTCGQGVTGNVSEQGADSVGAWATMHVTPPSLRWWA